jgi:hypothetical protein
LQGGSSDALEVSDVSGSPRGAATAAPELRVYRLVDGKFEDVALVY